MRAIEKYCGIK